VCSLHQEILDFYDWVRPHDFEQEIRQGLITRLQRIFSKIEPGCQLLPFGSFAAGLYLPTGDMDLVLMTRRLQWASKFPSRDSDLVYFTQRLLERERIAVPGSIQPIAKAKVPIVKFVDATTGLKVDISFNNDTGVIANNTFQQWKVQYPPMPILVSVIKQYLMIRGLNDVAFGGLGGFSIICLVTSLIQHQVPTGHTHNLSELLLNFFYLYGRVFNKDEIAIRLEPPGYVRKVNCLSRSFNFRILTHVKALYIPFQYNRDKPNRLAIIDPNKADNNISGGTAEIDLVFGCFSRAFDDLQEQMAQRELSGSSPTSLMTGLLGGDYEAYNSQRERLRRLHPNFNQSEQVTQPLPPKVSLSGPPEVAPPNPLASNGKAITENKGPSGTKLGRNGLSGKVRMYPSVARHP
jgi:non-canonical poly(A) RNA polymerase PAPD5/7